MFIRVSSYLVLLILVNRCDFDDLTMMMRIVCLFLGGGKNAMKEAGPPSNNHKREPPQMGMLTFRDGGCHFFGPLSFWEYHSVSFSVDWPS